jgi:hypothetical protein
MNLVQGQYSQIHNTTIENNWVTNVSPIDEFCHDLAVHLIENLPLTKVVRMLEKAEIYGNRLNVYYRLEKYGA